MKLKANFIFGLLISLISSYSFGQVNEYDYKRQLKDPVDQWHKVILPNKVFSKISPHLNDLRIIGISPANDTLEAPYILRLNKQKHVVNEVSFKLLNQSKNNSGHFFTFEVPAENPVSQILLDFQQKNFDWNIDVQGSHDQQEWFTVVDDYRILSIKNTETNYQFTKVTFPDSKYRFYRVHIKSQQKPDLKKAILLLNKVEDGSFRKYNIIKSSINQHKDDRITIIELTLDMPVPVSLLELTVKESYDYYRPVTIEYLKDSFKTEKGWKYNYNVLTSGTLSSLESNELNFNSTIAKNLRISIYNYDNQPLTIDQIEVKGYEHELIARFTEPASYALIYGNKKASAPKYDIDYFAGKIPDQLFELALGEEQKTGKIERANTAPLFITKTSLWSVMTVIILLLGWFSIKMMRKKPTSTK